MNIELNGLKRTAVKCDHLPFFESAGNFISGMPLRFIISIDLDIRLYRTGDTSIFPDLRLFEELYEPNIVLIPIGAGPRGHPELSPYEAALAIEWIHPEVATPMDYQPDSKDADLFIQYAKVEAPHTKTLKMKPGEVFNYKETALGNRIDGK